MIAYCSVLMANFILSVSLAIIIIHMTVVLCIIALRNDIIY